MEIDKFYGLYWPNTKAGEVAVVDCLPMIDKPISIATRLCNSNNIWENIDASKCESDTYLNLLHEVCNKMKLGSIIKYICYQFHNKCARLIFFKRNLAYVHHIRTSYLL